MTYRQPKLAKPQLQNDQLWQPLDTTESQAISGGLVLLFANPFAPMTPTDGLAGRLGIGG